MLETDPHAGRRDFERGMSYAPLVTLLLIGGNAIVYALEVSGGSLESEGGLLAAGALSTEELGRGEVWRLGTSMFLHGGLDHLLGNCFALYVLGMGCEHAFGALRMLPIYLACGVAGGLLSAAVEPAPTVGASGAIFGLLGCMAATLRRHRDRIFVRDHRIAVVLGVWALWSIATGFLDPHIANFAHIGGFAAGGLAAFLVRPPLLDAPARP